MNSRKTSDKIWMTLLVLLLALLVAPAPSGAEQDKKEKENHPSKTSAPPPKPVPPPRQVRPVTPNVQRTNPPPTHVQPPANATTVRPSGGAGPSTRTNPSEFKFEKPKDRPSGGMGANPPTAVHEGPATNYPAVRPSGGAGPSTRTNPSESKFEKPMVRPSGGAGTNPPTAVHERPGANYPAVRPSGGAGTNPPTAVHERPGASYPAVRPSGGVGTNPPTAVHRGPLVNRPAFRPPPNATRAATPGGGATYRGGKGQQWTVDRNNHVTGFSRPGMQANFRPDGRVHSLQVNRPDHSVMTVNHGLRGGRQTVAVRPGGVRVVTYGRNRGFVERPLTRPGGYISRTYVVGGRPYVHVYRPYYYHGVHYYRYVPAYYYRPVFYRWAFNPWPRPVVFTWGWGLDPWYGYYGGYFAPAPVYPTAALWLTDFLLAENLRLAYQARKDKEREYQEQREEAATPEVQTSSTEVTLTPEVKAAIAEEVRQQLAAEQAAAAQPSQPPEPNAPPPTAGNEVAPAALDPNQRMFVVSENLDVMEGGQPCALTPGDVIYRTGDNLLDGDKVAVNVLTSKAGDCPANSATEIDVSVLQEMHNQFREQIDAGLQTLAKNQGQNGLPSGPPPGAVAVPEGTAPPDPDAGSELTQQQQEADQAEGEAQEGSGGS